MLLRARPYLKRLVRTLSKSTAGVLKRRIFKLHLGDDAADQSADDDAEHKKSSIKQQQAYEALQKKCEQLRKDRELAWQDMHDFRHGTLVRRDEEIKRLKGEKDRLRKERDDARRQNENLQGLLQILESMTLPDSEHEIKRLQSEREQLRTQLHDAKANALLKEISLEQRI